MSAPAELIRNVPLFEGIEGKELQRLTEAFKERQFDAGDVIAEEGKSGVGFFVIAEGEAEVLVHGNPVDTLKPGEYFGEIALIDDGARTATVRAKDALTAYGLTAWDFRAFVESNAAVSWKLLVALAKLFRQSTRSEPTT
jgi:CRP/FNR family transcriptional regulator, cyclic AMP receptor protein